MLMAELASPQADQVPPDAVLQGQRLFILGEVINDHKLNSWLSYGEASLRAQFYGPVRLGTKTTWSVLHL